MMSRVPSIREVCFNWNCHKNFGHACSYRIFSSARSPSRSVPCDNDDGHYIEQWLEQIIKPNEFYERHAYHRRYFYNIDLQGRLFLEETRPKSIATSLKSEAFLNFFFRQIRRISDEEIGLLKYDHDAARDYPFVSPCGQEMNFIRPADEITPIVFHGLSSSSSSSCNSAGGDSPTSLIFGGSLIQQFSSDALVISKTNNRLYHRLLHCEGRMTNDEQKAPRQKYPSKLHQYSVTSGSPEYGLIQSALAVELSNNFEATEEDFDVDVYSGMDFVEGNGSIRNKIPWLPEDHEN
uniref:Uncharacterized protein n=1 Tax=Leptocylindrus danicus TaxID=163516 RepID=A0A7S2JS56_9STRA|mmetsp:Transcript_10971/g.16564  ORF Transcript_10971/g.16564 Transcript_10971/m.16564 type:complete len:293 (+) Transcript_10971:89-967(+)